MAHNVARRKRHFFQLADIPSRQNKPTARRIGLDFVDEPGKLVDALIAVVGMHVSVWRVPVPPLEAVDRTEISFLAVVQSDRIEVLSGPVALPDHNFFLFEQVAVGAASHEP